MRIGIDTLFLNGRQRSSLANFVVAFVEAMVRESDHHQLVLFASPTTAKFFDKLPAGSAEIVLCPVSNEDRLARIFYQQVRLSSLIMQHRVDVLCCLADVAPLRVKVPTVLKVNSLHHLTVPRALGFARRSYRRFMIGMSARRARFVVANSKPAAADIEALLGVPSERIRLVYEAVDDSFAPCSDLAELSHSLEGDFGIRDRYLLFVSALYRYKNLDSVIRALSLLATNGWIGNLVVAGPDPDSTQLDSKNLAARLGLANRVIFLGPVENKRLRALYCGASALVYPSASETFGKPIVEAMMCGTPIVAANRGSIPDIAAGAALLVDPDSVEAIAHGIAQVLEDDNLRDRMREIGLKRGGDFSWRSVAIGFTKVLEEAGA
jgi:glycosyltransferase involved in cell wall biosynthesis